MRLDLRPSALRRPAIVIGDVEAVGASIVEHVIDVMSDKVGITPESSQKLLATTVSAPVANRHVEKMGMLNPAQQLKVDRHVRHLLESHDAAPDDVLEALETLYRWLRAWKPTK